MTIRISMTIRSGKNHFLSINETILRRYHAWFSEEIYPKSLKNDFLGLYPRQFSSFFWLNETIQTAFLVFADVFKSHRWQLFLTISMTIHLCIMYAFPASTIIYMPESDFCFYMPENWEAYRFHTGVFSWLSLLFQNSSRYMPEMELCFGKRERPLPYRCFPQKKPA